ncbi:MarR family winged helix-turn-helix transcriptional regulator [uncultured Adlercreutzia sp.]|uniref:MarR family winged helix-turn-helix transcriptional regulator n=1 Tax=uncultured Adlercreutzia sp. TaxID=875803 RepID=UPI0026F3E2A9|nr:MarR family transcriptional regulator [uncultured Adlercreutzia sp.]
MIFPVNDAEGLTRRGPVAPSFTERGPMHYHPTSNDIPSSAFLESQLDAILSEDDIDTALTLQLLSLYHLLARRFMRQAFSQTDPHSNPLRGQGQVIALLKHRDGLSTREMAELLDIRTASLNELLVKLESKGFIERCKSESDGRVTIARLTETGRAIDQMPFLSEMSSYYDALTDEEKQTLLTLLASVEQAAHDVPDSDDETMGFPCVGPSMPRGPWSKMHDYINAHRLGAKGD